MSFQWIIDNAETISIESKKIAAQTTARDGTSRTVSRGGQVWKIEAKLPDGLRWSDIRQNIAKAEALDKVTTTSIQFNNTGQDWLYKYQGSYTNLTAYGGAIAVGNIVRGSSTITLTTSGTLSSGYKFRAGDYIQLGSGNNVYRVASDVAYNSNTVTLHRPVLESTSNGVYIKVAQYCTWNVICTQYPSWTIFSRDQVAWSGPFVFVENVIA